MKTESVVVRMKVVLAKAFTFAALVAGAAVVEPKATDEVLCNPGIYTLAVSVGRKDGKPEIALPLEGGIDRIYPVGKIEVVSKMRGRQFTE